MNERAPGAGFRVGWGFDAHSLNTEPPLILGGVVVSESEGVSATSDGDVLAHAVTDAILGSCSLGDLGQHNFGEPRPLDNAACAFQPCADHKLVAQSERPRAARTE